MSPASMSRRLISNSGSSDWGVMSAQASPTFSTNGGTVSMLNMSGWTEPSSSQPKGMDTWAPGRARTDQAPNTVLWGAFWLKSMKTRLPRSSFHHAAVHRSGRRRSSSRARAGGLGPPVDAQFGQEGVYHRRPLLKHGEVDPG